jgi:flagellar basal-body rod modification protein FlgD
LNANFDTFVKMLTTQLQFQDPMKPMDTTEFTNQLVMYSQVEQQLSANDKLDKLINLQQGQGVQAALGYMGWEVSTDSSNLPLQNGEGHFVVSVTKPAATVSLSVTDSNGKYIRGLSLSDVNATTGELVWDGKDSNGNKMPDGTYKISIAAKDTAGSSVPSSVKTYGIVTAVDVDSSGNTILKMGDTAIAPSAITSVRTPVKATTTGT